jgi:hypothetical protein
MDSNSKEKIKLIIESKYKKNLKSNEIFYNRDKNQAKNRFNNKSIINDNKNLNEKREEQKFTFTNLILRKKLDIEKVSNNINVDKNQKANKKEIISEDDQLKKLINIHKLLSIKSIKSNNKIILKNPINPENNEKKKPIHKNLSNLSLDNLYNSKKNKKIFIKKESKGQQTILNNNYSNLNLNHFDNKRISLDANILKNNKFNLERKKSKENIKRNNNNNNNKISINIIDKRNNKELENEEKNEEEITDYMNNINIPNSLNNHHNNSISKGDKNKNKSFRLIHNKSNIVDVGNIKLEQKKYSMSIREIYRNLILTEKNKIKKSKIKSVLKNKKIVECMYRNCFRENKYNIKSNNHLVSLENYTNDRKKILKSNKVLIFRKNKNKTLPAELKLIDKNKLFGTVKKKHNDDSENFFNNILKSFSRADEKVNKMKLKMIN